MKIRVYLLFQTLIVLFTIVFIGCKDEPNGPPQIVIPSDTEAIVYSKHIAPIFLNSCGGSGCHLSGQHYSNLALDTWESAMNGSDYGSVIIPFSSAKSHLFEHINTDTLLGPRSLPLMPLSRDPLPLPQILTIKRWINEGAKNDNGEIALGAPGRLRVFVTDQSEDMVTVIDQATQRIYRYVTVGSRPDSSTPPEAPHNTLLSPDGNYLYVNLILTGTIEKYDARTFAKLGTCTVGSSPSQIISTSDGKTLYVSNYETSGTQKYVLRVDATSMTVTATLQISGKAPHGVTLSADEKTLYTMNANSDDISVIDLATNQEAGRIPIQPGAPPITDTTRFEPYQSVLSSDGKTMFVTCRKGGEVRVVDLTFGKVTDSIVVGLRPQILAISPNGQELWIPNQSSNTVSIISVPTHQVIKTIGGFLENAAPHAIGFTADGKWAYLTCEHQKGSVHHPTLGTVKIPGLVYIIDTSTRVPMKRIEVGGFAAGIAIEH